MGPGAVDLQLPLADSCTLCDLDRKVGSSWIKLDPVRSAGLFFELGWGHSLQHDDWRRWCPRWMLSVAGSKDGWNQRSTQMKRGSRGCFGQYHWVYPSSWRYWLLAWSRHLAGDLCGHMGGWQQSQIRIWSCRQAPIEILGGLWMKCVMTLCSNFDVGHSNLVWPCQSSYGFRGPTFRTHLGHMRRYYPVQRSVYHAFVLPFVCSKTIQNQFPGYGSSLQIHTYTLPVFSCTPPDFHVRTLPLSRQLWLHSSAQGDRDEVLVAIFALVVPLVKIILLVLGEFWRCSKVPWPLLPRSNFIQGMKTWELRAQRTFSWYRFRV